MRKWMVAAVVMFSLNHSLSSNPGEDKIILNQGVEHSVSTGARSTTELRYNKIFFNELQLSGGGYIGAGKTTMTSYHMALSLKHLKKLPLGFKLVLMNNAYHYPKSGNNSLITAITWRSKYFESDLGINLRFHLFNKKLYGLIFYFPTEIIHPHVHYRIAGYLNFSSIPLRAGLEFKNFETYIAYNTFVFTYALDFQYILNPRLTLTGNLGVTESGLDGVSVIYQRFFIRCGAQYSL